MKVGDIVGGIYQKELPDGRKIYELVESKINKITENTRGKKCYPAKHFYPLDVEDVESSTAVMEKAKGFVVQREICILTPKIREHFERWVVWANEHPDEVKPLIG